MQNNPVILFDGVCKLCNGSVDFIVKRDRSGIFRFIALQSEEGEKYIKRFHIPDETDSVVLVYRNRVYTESEAIIEICRFLPSPWKWIAGIKILPEKWRNNIYRLIARNRYFIFGKNEKCRMNSFETP